MFDKKDGYILAIFQYYQQTLDLFRLLGTRIAELEHRIKVLEISGLWSTPGGVEHKSDENHYEPTITWEEVEEEVKEEDEGEGIVYVLFIIFMFSLFLL